MEASESPKTITLRPSWKQYFIPYLLAVLTMPLLIGLIAFYLIRKRHNNIRYIIADDRITVINQDISQNVDLDSIKRVEKEQSWLDEKLGIGTILLHTEMSSASLKGLENFKHIKSTIEKAIVARQKLKKQAKSSSSKSPDKKPGSMERMDYLTGLWQQGLISNEEYRQERKKFE